MPLHILGALEFGTLYTER